MRRKNPSPVGGAARVEGPGMEPEEAWRRFAAWRGDMPCPAGERPAATPRRGGRRWPGRDLFPRVKAFQNGLQFAEIDMGIDRRGGQAFVSEQLLQERQGRPALQHMGRAGMA